MVSLTIDDGWRESGMVAAEILEKYGGRGTFYIVTPRIGRPGIFTTNDLRDLRLRGHDVDPHSLSHTNLTLSSVEERQVEEEINLSRADILKWGCGPATTFAYPFGAFSESVIRMVREAGMRGACGTDGGLNDMATLEPFALKRRSLQSTSYYWNITAEIDEAVAQKKWLILLVHFVEPVPSHDFSITPEFLEDVIAYAAYKNARIVTVSEGLEIMGQSP
jgi:peptidoglycan/xylan/chitin deacetylase (PgdA/CDA1 family)